MKFATVKKWLALLLASCMVMALAACGKTADDTGTTGGDTGDTGRHWQLRRQDRRGVRLQRSGRQIL